MRLNKLQPPPAAANFIARPRLEDLAERIAEFPLTVVRAGGGFGKTTLLRAWGDRLGDRAHVAWLSLEQHDASTTGVVEALNASFARALPGFGSSAKQLLDQGVQQFTRLISALSNELIAWIEEHDSSVVLFVDDVQFVADEKGAIDALGELLRALPERAHVVLASRSALRFAPLGKMRASGSVNDVEEEDLRFSLAEATELLADEKAAGAFLEHTEGWAIALGLTAQIVRADPNAWRRAVSGSREAIFNFLAEEVIERLPAELREQLCVLAVPAAIDDAYASTLLAEVRYEAVVAQVQERGLYLTQLEEKSWRFHHLFRDFLLERFRRSDPQRLRSLQIQYAQLLRKNGLKMDALGQLLDAGDYEQIVEYVHEALVAIRSDRYRRFLTLLSRVPEGVMQLRPMLHRFYGMALVRDGKYEQAEEQLTLAYERSLAIQDFGTACAAQMELGNIADRFFFLRHGQFKRSEAHFERAVSLAETPELADRPLYRGVMHWHLGMALACRGNYSEAFEHLGIAEQIERAADRHVDLTIVEIAGVHGWMGNWSRTLEYAELAEEYFRSGAGTFQVGRALMAQAQAHLAMRPGSPRCSESAGAAVKALSEDQPDDLPAALVLFARAALNHSPPSIETANKALAEASERLESTPNPVIDFELCMARVEATLLSGQPESARDHVARAKALAESLDDPWQRAMVEFMRGLCSLVGTDQNDAQLRFVSAGRGFAEVGDRYHQVLAELSAQGCAARLGTASRAEIERLFNHILQERLDYVCASAPRASMSILVWCLNHECELEKAETLFGGMLGQNASELAPIAQNIQLAADSRAAAIRMIAKASPLEARTVIKPLCMDADPLVAGTARATLDYLPSPTVPRIRISVIGELQAGIAGDLIGEKDERWGRKRAAELLRYLAIANTSVSKSAVISALWPESENVADTTLRVTLHLLRRALQPDADGSGDYVFYDGAVMRLGADLFEGTDADEADSALRRADLLSVRNEIESARSAFNLAISVYSKAPREEDVTDWLRPHVRHWRNQCVRAYHGLAKLERASGNTEAALRATQYALNFDALNEETVSLLLDLYSELGEAEAGKAAFATYKRRLGEQLGSSPGPAIVERYTKILQRRTGPSLDQLSPREREVLTLVARGLSNKQIGTELSLSTWTVNNHVAKILKKLGVESRTAAAAVAGSQ